MMERKTVLTAVVLLGLLCAAVAQAELYVSTAFGNGADTYITNNVSGKQTSTQNWGTEGKFRARAAVNSRFMAGFLRFDISGVTDPFAADTKLQLDESWAKAGGRTLSVYGLVDETLDNWGETTITYANAPGFLTPQIGDNGATVAGNNLGNYAFESTKLMLLGTIAIPAAPAGTSSSGGTVNVRIWSKPGLLPLADFLNNMDTNDLVTLVLINNVGSNSEDEFATKENAVAGLGVRAPALVPEPATMLILGLGGLLAARRRK